MTGYGISPVGQCLGGGVRSDSTAAKQMASFLHRTQKSGPSGDQRWGRESAGTGDDLRTAKLQGRSRASRLFALRTNRVGRLAVDRAVSHFEGCIVHT